MGLDSYPNWGQLWGRNQWTLLRVLRLFGGHVGYGPRPAKSLCVIASNSFSVDNSTLSSQSRY
jgi:hypothetical protein